MKIRYHANKSGKLFLFAIILIFTSCNSYKQTADYPMVHSVYHKKSGFQSIVSINQAHIVSCTKDFATVNYAFVPDAKSNKESEGIRLTRPKEITDLSYIPLVTSRSFLNNYGNNPGTLTASLFTQPLLINHKISPDTTILPTITNTDSTKNKITQTPTSGVSNDKNFDPTKQKRRETFANISFIAGLCTIASVFVVPIILLPLAIVAIVFGALGLKSTKRKKARIGMIIGITMFALIFLLTLAYAAALGAFNLS